MPSWNLCRRNEKFTSLGRPKLPDFTKSTHLMFISLSHETLHDIGVKFPRYMLSHAMFVVEFFTYTFKFLYYGCI